MKFPTNPKSLFIILNIILSLLLTACGASVEKYNNKGNEAYLKGEYEQALVAYQAAQIESPELAEPYYNAANALYRQRNYAEALKQLNIALSYAGEETLINSGLYNLGNNAFSTQELDKAVEAYKGALLINPGDMDAKYNLELALQQQEQQQQEQEQQEQEQQQNQQEESNQDQNSENQDSDQEQNQDNGAEDQADQSQNENQQQGDQPEGDSDSNESDSKEDAQNGENQSQDDKEDQSDQGDEQNQDGQNGQDNQDQNQGQPQDGNPENQDQNDSNGHVPAPGQRMTAEQAQQLLAAIAQDMETLQERLGQVLFVQELPPTQDW